MKKQKEKDADTKNGPGNNNGATKNSNSVTNNNNSNHNNKKKTKTLELSTCPVRYVAKRTTPQVDVIFEPMQRTDRLLGTKNRQGRSSSNKLTSKITKTRISRLQLNF